MNDGQRQDASQNAAGRISLPGVDQSAFEIAAVILPISDQDLSQRGIGVEDVEQGGAFVSLGTGHRDRNRRAPTAVPAPADHVGASSGVSGRDLAYGRDQVGGMAQAFVVAGSAGG